MFLEALDSATSSKRGLLNRSLPPRLPPSCQPPDLSCPLCCHSSRHRICSGYRLAHIEAALAHGIGRSLANIMSDAPKPSLDVELLSRGSAAQVVVYLRQQLGFSHEGVVSEALLHLIEIEAVPSDVSRIWLSIAKDPASLFQAIQQRHSDRLRRSAIRRFAVWMRSKAWKAAWEALGSAEGITKLLAEFSVDQVRMFTRWVGSSVRGIDDHHKAEKREAVSELLGLLVPELRSATTSEDVGHDQQQRSRDTSEGRDLVNLYALLVPACTSAMVRHVLFSDQQIMKLRGNQGHLLREHAHVFLDSHHLKSNWIDQEQHLPALLLSVASSSSRQQDPSQVDRFLSQTLELILANFDRASKTTRRGGAETPETEPYEPDENKNPATALFQQLVEHRDLLPDERKHRFEIVLSVLAQHDRHHEAARAGMWRQAARSWSEAPSLFEPILMQLFRLEDLPGRSYTFAELQSSVQRKQRWELLKLIHLARPERSVDLDDDDELRKVVTSDVEGEMWSVSIFLALDKQHALHFMDRLATVLPRDRMILGGLPDSILSYSMRGGCLSFDMVRFEIDPEANSEERIRVATSAVEDCKKQVSRSSDPSDRRHLACCALIWATCSRSLELYTSTVVWLRRYARDVAVARSLFSKSNVHKREAIQLLSGIPIVLDRATTAEQVRGCIVAANHALWEWFETVRTSALEPSFIITDAAGARSLIQPVILERMRRIDQLQEHLGLDTAAVSALVWDDTVQLLIRIEETCMQPDFRRLHFYNLAGPLAKEVDDQLLTSDAVKIRSEAGFSFVEKHFVARDALWKQHRLSLNPAVAKLPQGLPKGLPLHLAPGIWNLDYILPKAPDCFLLRKARDIVFADPEMVLQPLPSDEDALNAIGECREDYEFALLLLIKAQRGKVDKFEVLHQAWLHATTVLSQGAPSKLGAEVFWRMNVFNRPLLDKRFPDPSFLPGSHPDPQLPSSKQTQGHSPVVWDASGISSYSKPGGGATDDRKHIVLDTMIRHYVVLNVYDGSLCFHTGRFDECGGWSAQYSVYCARPFAVPHEGGPLKDIKQYQRSMREAKTVLNLLLFEESCPGDDSVIPLPFPSQSEARYPNVVLSPSLVERAAFDTDEEAQRNLPKHAATVPPTLLRQLAEAFTAARADGRLTKTSRVPINLLRCLEASDRPAEAIDLALNAILDNPDDSSWHRSLFSPKFLRRLSARDAQLAMETLAAKILERTGPSTGDSRQERGAGIKISTVKLLAQALVGNWISTTVAVDILMQLLDRSDHVDIRHAAFSSMLSIVCARGNTEDATAGLLISKLETLVPIIAALDETRPDESLQPWTEGSLPSIYAASSIPGSDLWPMNALPRTFELVADALKTHKLWAPVLMQRILVPAIQQSIEYHRRWLDSFLERYSLSTEMLGLPVPPSKLEMLNRLVTRHAHLTPDWIVQLYCETLTFVLHPPRQVKKINARLKGSQDNAEKHWLATFRTPKSHRLASLPFFVYYVYDLAASAADEASSVELLTRKAAAIGAARELLWHVIGRLLDAPSVDTSAFEQVMQRLAYSYGRVWEGKVGRKQAWTRCIRPVLKSVVSMVDSLRTPAWQRDPKRRPTVLPDMFEYRLWLLPIPDDDEALSTEEQVQQCRLFALALSAQVVELVTRAVPGPDEMAKLRKAAAATAPRHHSLIATKLGELGSGGLHERLCVELAASLLVTARDVSDESALEVQQMLLTWHRSEVEWIRIRLERLVNLKGYEVVRDPNLVEAVLEALPQYQMQ